MRVRLSGEKNGRWKGGLKTYTCQVCGIEFKSKPSDHRITCSRECQHKWIWIKSGDKIRAKFSARANDHFKGRKHTEESKRLMGRANYNGAEKYIKGGYVMVYSPGHPHSHYGRVAEHILVAEMGMGSRIPDGYVVHHKNGIKTDNRPENLLVCTQSEHMAIHAKARVFKLK